MTSQHAGPDEPPRQGATARKWLAGAIGVAFAALAIWTYVPGTWRLCNDRVMKAPESTKTIRGPSGMTTEINTPSSSTTVECRSAGLADAWPAAVLIVVLLLPEVGELTVAGLFTLKFKQRIEARERSWLNRTAASRSW